MDATSILGATKPALDVLSSVRSWFRRDQHYATLKFVPNRLGCFWGEGTYNGKPATSLRGSWFITNIGPARNVHILDAYTRWPKQLADIPPRPDSGGAQAGGDSSTPVECSAYFMLPGAIGKRGKPITKTIVFVDQFNHKHRVRTTFRSAQSV
jgi:hypothetical protein